MTYTITEVNATTGEVVTRDMTESEIAELQKVAADNMKYQQELEAAEQAKEEAKAAALAKLTALGLTEEEAKAIAG